MIAISGKVIVEKESDQARIILILLYFVWGGRYFFFKKYLFRKWVISLHWIRMCKLTPQSWIIEWIFFEKKCCMFEGLIISNHQKKKKKKKKKKELQENLSRYHFQNEITEENL